MHIHNLINGTIKMMKEHYYCVAEFIFTITLSEQLNIDNLLPSFKSFRCERDKSKEKLFNLIAVSHPLYPIKESTYIHEEIINDMGYIHLIGTTEGYRIEIRFNEDSPVHHMQINTYFSFAIASINWTDPNAGNVLCSLLRIIYSQAVLFKNAISLHASVVSTEGKAYLFMGKSGIGKSTHSKLWIKNIIGSELLNDDNPTIRIKDDKAKVYGTPWSGKTPCYKNKAYPIAGMVRLYQAKENTFTHQENIDAFITLLPGCSIIKQDETLHNILCETLIQFTNKVKIGKLSCLPEKEAAFLCFEEITNKIK